MAALGGELTITLQSEGAGKVWRGVEVYGRADSLDQLGEPATSAQRELTQSDCFERLIVLKPDSRTLRRTGWIVSWLGRRAGLAREIREPFPHRMARIDCDPEGDGSAARL